MAWIWLRGLGRETAHWGGLPSKLEAITGEKVITLDLPGVGRKRGENCSLTMSTVVQQLQGDTNGYTDIKILAHSLGGPVALNWAAQDERVSKVVLVNSSSRLNFFARGLKWVPVFGLLASFASKATVEERERKILAIISNNRRAAAGVKPLWVEVARRRPIALQQFLRQIALGVFSDLPKPIEIQNCNLEVLASSKDRLVSVDCSRKLAEYYNCSLVTHPDAGHDIPLDDPDWLLDQLQVKAPWGAISPAGCN